MKAATRIVYPDLLRIFSTFSMIVIHVSAKGLSTEIGSYTWQVCNVYDGLTHFVVPVFVMLSGAFMLDPERSLSTKKLWKEKMPRLLSAFAFWSLVYAVITLWGKKVTLFAVLEVFFKGHFHLWFIFMIAMLYVLTPLLRKITQDRKMTEYFLAVSFVSFFVLYFIVQLLSRFQGSSEAVKSLYGVLNYVRHNLHFEFVCGYTFYYFAGYYFKQFELGQGYKRLVYVLGAAAVLAIPSGTYALSSAAGKNDFLLYGYYAPTMCALSVAVFVFFKYCLSKLKLNDKALKVIAFVSKHSFGVYLVHDIFIIMFSRAFAVDCLSFNPLFSVLVLSLAVFAAALALSFVVGKIPLLKKCI